MKKFLAIGLLSAALVAISQQEASAWCKWNFSAGINMSYEGANNSLFWGAYNCGQVPGYPSDALWQGGHFGPAPGCAAPAYGYAAPAPVYGYGAPAPSGSEWQAPAPKPAEAPKKTEQANWYGNQQYQPAVYQYSAPNSYYYQPAPQFNYYQPNAAYQQAPSYWYGY